MPSVKIHCAISKKRTGKGYHKLHKWIDSKRGVNHRDVNHFYTTKLKKYVYDNFGGADAVSEWLFHIALDNLDTYITNEWEHNENTQNLIRFGFSESGFIYIDEDEIFDDELKKEFEFAYEDE